MKRKVFELEVFISVIFVTIRKELRVSTNLVLLFLATSYALFNQVWIIWWKIFLIDYILFFPGLLCMCWITRVPTCTNLWFAHCCPCWWTWRTHQLLPGKVPFHQLRCYHDIPLRISVLYCKITIIMFQLRNSRGPCIHQYAYCVSAPKYIWYS